MPTKEQRRVNHNGWIIEKILHCAPFYLFIIIIYFKWGKRIELWCFSLETLWNTS